MANHPFTHILERSDGPGAVRPASRSYSVKALSDLIAPKPEVLLERLGLDDHELEYAAKRINRVGAYRALTEFCLAEGLGIRHAHIERVMRDHVIFEKVDDFDLNMGPRTWATKYQIEHSPKSPYRSFPCSLIIRNRVLEPGCEREFGGHPSLTVALQLPGKDRAKFDIFTPKERWKWSPDTFGSMNVIPLAGNNIIVTRVSNPIYNSLRGKEWIERYKDWDKILFFALQRLIVKDPLTLSKMCEVQFEKNSRIGICFFAPRSGMGTLGFGWHASSFLELLKANSYVEVAPSMRRGNTGENTDKDAVNGLYKLISSEVNGDGSGNVSLSRIKNNRLASWMRILRSELPDEEDIKTMRKVGLPNELTTDRAIILGERDLRKQISTSFEFAPTDTFLLSKRKAHRKLDELNNANLKDPDINLISKAMPPGFIPISKGIGNGISNVWWKLPQDGGPSGWELQALHLRHQNRHPSIRFLERDKSGEIIRMLCLGLKGAGLGQIPDDEFVQLPKSANGLRLPFYPRLHHKDFPGGPDAELGGFAPGTYGGLSEYQAESELVRSLAITGFVSELAPDLISYFPRVIGYKSLLSVPFWNSEGETLWTSPLEYQKRFLKDGLENAFTPCVVENVVRCDVRIAEAIGLIFSPENFSRYDDSVRDWTEGLAEIVKFIYFANGEKVDCSILQKFQGTEVDLDTTLKALNQIYLSNIATADRIMTRIRRDSLSLVGLLHGTDSHLGGVSIGRNGDVNGGMTGLRNMDLAGGLNDFGGRSSLKFAKKIQLDYGEAKCGSLMRKIMQSGDLLHWEESMYWLDRIFRGSSTGAKGVEESVYSTFGKVSTLIDGREGSNWILDRSRGIFSKRPDPKEILFFEGERDLYSQKVIEGKRWMKDA